MTGIVFLRSGFGYLFLRPKSVFIAFAWAMTLYTIYAINEPAVWRTSAPICVFGMLAAILYLSHLAAAVASQLRRKAAHDQHSGTSHMFHLMRLLKLEPSEQTESKIHLWVEPGVIFAASVLLRIPLGNNRVSGWLGFVAVCLWLKEAINYWAALRLRKRQEDIFDDAEETVAPVDALREAALPSATRKPRTKRTRTQS